MDTVELALPHLLKLHERDAERARCEEGSADKIVQSQELSQMSPNLDQSPRLVKTSRRIAKTREGMRTRHRFESESSRTHTKVHEARLLTSGANTVRKFSLVRTNLRTYAKRHCKAKSEGLPSEMVCGSKSRQKRSQRSFSPLPAGPCLIDYGAISLLPRSNS